LQNPLFNQQHSLGAGVYNALADRCSYTETPKYRCPRCRTQTCSLPCYKKHQQRASCSGKRDPAAYLKKNQLATPSGLDQDYNYLKGIERTIERASQQSGVHNPNKKYASSRNAARAWQPDSSLQKYLIENRISVDRAPRGMSRQQTNTTRSTKSKRVVWTVEWVDQAGKRGTQHNCLESETLTALRRMFEIERSNAAKRQAHVVGDLATQPRPLKRKRNDAPQDSPQPHPQPKGPSQSHETEARGNGNDNPEPDIIISTTDQYQPLAAASTTDYPPTLPTTNASTSPETPHHFYLLRPATTTSSQVLIPLDPTSSLTQSLRDRTVQEYPTIFTLDAPPASLPSGYTLEEDYLRTRRDQDARDFPQAFERDTAGAPDVAREEPLDARGILDMLRRDVRSR